MKRLLLISSGLAAIRDFVCVAPSSLKMLFIPSAGNPYDDTWWIDKDRAVLKEMGFQMTEVDIEGKSDEALTQAIATTDVLYVAGGNTFFLLQQLRATGFDQQIISFIEAGGLFIGASAGAITAGPDIEPARQFDDPDHLIDLASSRGFGLVNFIPFPHYDMSDRTSAIDKLISEYKKQYTVIPITDDQAIVVNDHEYRVVDSKRTDKELAWPQ